MNRIFVLSDLHNRAEIESVIVPEAADAIVLAGDIVHAEIAFEHFAGFGKPVIVVLGNHDFDGMDILDGVDAMQDMASQYDNVYVLNNETLIINGVRFIGSTFWVSYGDLHPRLVVECNEYLTDSYKIQAVKWLADEGNRASIEFMAAQMAAEARRMKSIQGHLPDAGRIIERGRFHPFVGYQLHKAAFKFVSDELAKPFDGKTVVVTHHPPTYEIRRQWSSADMDAWNQLPFVPWGADRYGYQSFSELLGGYGSPLEQAFFRKGWPILQENGYVEGTGELMGADLWIHGHTHESYEYALAGTRFVVNAQDVPVRRFADNIVSLDDGLEGAQWLALKRLERKLNEVIGKLKPWLECPQLEQIIFIHNIVYVYLRMSLKKEISWNLSEYMHYINFFLLVVIQLHLMKFLNI